MDEKLIALAAEAAVNDLQLDCQVASIYRRKERETWCIKFSGSYREFCDGFRSRYGEENSAEVVREKIKRHLLKSPKPTGRRKGVSNRSAVVGPEKSLLDLPLQIAGSALAQSARIVGELINGTVNAAETVIKTVADAAITAGQAIIEPPQLQTGIIITASDSARSSTAKTRQPAKKKRADKKAAKSAGKKPTKTSKKTARKTSTKKAVKKRTRA